MRFIKHFKSPFTSLYDEARLPAVIRRSLLFILLGNICGSLYGVVLGSSSNAMIALANRLGAGDLEYGLMNGIPQIAALMQIPFSIMVARSHKRKQYMLTYGLASRAILLLFAALPFVFPEYKTNAALITMLTILSLSSVLSACINVCWFPWFADLTPIGIRGRWLSIRDAFLAASTVVCGLLTAWVLDGIGGDAKFLIVFSIGGAVGVLDMIFFGFAKETYASPPKAVKLLDAIKEIWRNKPFLRFMMFWTAWCFASNLSAPFLNRYALGEMGLTNMQVTLFGTVAVALVTILIIPRWGKLLNAFGCKPVMRISGYCSTLALALFLLMRKGSVIPYLLYSVLSATFLCATTLACNSMQLSYSPDDERASYIAFFSCITCLVGTALGNLTGGALLDISPDIIFNGFDKYKMLISISGILRLAVVALCVGKLTNDRDGDERALISSLFKRRK